VSRRWSDFWANEKVTAFVVGLLSLIDDIKKARKGEGNKGKGKRKETDNLTTMEEIGEHSQISTSFYLQPQCFYFYLLHQIYVSTNQELKI